MFMKMFYYNIVNTQVKDVRKILQNNYCQSTTRNSPKVNLFVQHRPHCQNENRTLDDDECYQVLC